MLRMTFDFSENEHKMSDFLTDRASEVARAMNPREIKLNRRTGSFSIVPYQTTHNTGGAIPSGDNPKNSVVNKYLKAMGCAQCILDGGAECVPAITPATTRQAPWPRWPITPPMKFGHVI